MQTFAVVSKAVTSANQVLLSRFFVEKKYLTVKDNYTKKNWMEHIGKQGIK